MKERVKSRVEAGNLLQSVSILDKSSAGSLVSVDSCDSCFDGVSLEEEGKRKRRGREEKKVSSTFPSFLRFFALSRLT